MTSAKFKRIKTVHHLYPVFCCTTSISFPIPLNEHWQLMEIESNHIRKKMIEFELQTYQIHQLFFWTFSANTNFSVNYHFLIWLCQFFNDFIKSQSVNLTTVRFVVSVVNVINKIMFGHVYSIQSAWNNKQTIEIRFDVKISCDYDGTKTKHSYAILFTVHLRKQRYLSSCVSCLLGTSW